MNGTEKQIEWAEKIRAEWIANLLASIPDSHRPQAAAMIRGEIAAPGDMDIICKIYAVSDAKWWIDNRHHTGRTLARAVASGKVNI